ncbi:hypothetical protein ABBQ32_009899 [Trebouxia sp. C0010 RCD-2024]
MSAAVCGDKCVGEGAGPSISAQDGSTVSKTSILGASEDVSLFRLPSVLLDCILARVRPIDAVSLRLSCRAGTQRLSGHVHVKFTGQTAEVGSWLQLLAASTHVTLCGAIPTLLQLSKLTYAPRLSRLPAFVLTLSSLVMLVVQPHFWPLDVPVYVTFSSLAHLPQLQLEVWVADGGHLKLTAATDSQPLMMPALLDNPLSCQAHNTLVLINNSKQPTRVVWRSGIDTLWVVSHGHLQILQVSGTALLQGVRQVCIAYPCLLSSSEAGELNIMALSSRHPTPLHCSFDTWLATTEMNLEQLALERFIYCGMNFIVSQGYRDCVLQKYSDLTDGVYAGFASGKEVTQSAAV